MGARNFREYPIWKESVDMATEIYHITGDMPWFEKKGLCDQLQRAVVSISSNIAEGAAMNTDAEFARFLDYALGSSFETETQLQIAKNIGYISAEQCDNLTSKLISIQKQINGLINTLRIKSKQ